MAFALPIDKKVTLSVSFQDSKGNPARVDGSPEWFIDNDQVGAITPSEDGMSCALASVGPIGTGTVSMRADADMGDGVKPIVGSFEFEITPGEAVAVTINHGGLEDQ